MTTYKTELHICTESLKRATHTEGNAQQIKMATKQTIMGEYDIKYFRCTVSNLDVNTCLLVGDIIQSIFK